MARHGVLGLDRRADPQAAVRGLYAVIAWVVLTSAAPSAPMAVRLRHRSRRRGRRVDRRPVRRRRAPSHGRHAWRADRAGSHRALASSRALGGRGHRRPHRRTSPDLVAGGYAATTRSATSTSPSSPSPAPTCAEAAARSRQPRAHRRCDDGASGLLDLGTADPARGRRRRWPYGDLDGDGRRARPSSTTVCAYGGQRRPGHGAGVGGRRRRRRCRGRRALARAARCRLTGLAARRRSSTVAVGATAELVGSPGRHYDADDPNCCLGAARPPLRDELDDGASDRRRAGHHRSRRLERPHHGSWPADRSAVATAAAG